MSRWLDPVEAVREAVTEATGVPTTRVLDPSFTSGPMPLVHVSLVSSALGDIDRTSTVAVDVYAVTPSARGEAGAQALAELLVDAVDDKPLASSEGYVDAVTVTQVGGVRPYFETVEVVPVTLDITYRPRH